MKRNKFMKQNQRQARDYDDWTPMSEFAPTPASKAGYVGTVTRFENGWGFISFDQDGRDARAFVHWSNLLMPGYKTLEVGQTVEFDVEREEKGLKALNVQVID